MIFPLAFRKHQCDSKIAALEHEIKVLRSSTSWKVTAPLRALSTMVLSVSEFSSDLFIFLLVAVFMPDGDANRVGHFSSF